MPLKSKEDPQAPNPKKENPNPELERCGRKIEGLSWYLKALRERLIASLSCEDHRKFNVIKKSAMHAMHALEV